MTAAIVFRSQAEIQTDRFGVANVRVSVWLGWESGYDIAGDFTGSAISINNLLNKVSAFAALGD